MSRPERKIIGNEHHRLSVFKVLKTFPNGTPRILERISEIGATNIQGGEWFVTAYVPESTIDADEVAKLRKDGSVGPGSPEGWR